MKLFLFIISFLFTSSVFANNPGVSYQGRIFKPDGYPLEGANVQFRMQVRSPGAENCLLFEEIQTINMSGSLGVFSITLNDGTGTRLDSPTYQVDRIFANRDVMTLDTTRCAVGTSYTPNTGDGRKFVVYFKDETMAAYEPLPVMNLNYAPQAMYALEAQKVGTFAVNNILRTVDVSGNPVTAPALNPTQLTNLNNLLAGTSTQYATATDFSTVQTFAKAALPTCGAGEVLKANGTAFSCVVDSAGGAPAYSAITAATAANTIDNTSYAQTWNWSTATTQSPMSLSANALTTGSGLNLTTSSAALNSTNGFLNVANTGASTSGILARMQSNSTAGSGLTVLTNGNVGIGTASPSALLSLVRDAASGTSPNGIIISTAANGAAQGWYGPEVIGRSAGDSVSVPVSSLDGAILLRLTGQSFSSDGYVNSAQISLHPDGVSAWESHPGKIIFSTTPNGSNSLLTRMTIDNSGKVGIGTASPTANLEVTQTSSASTLPNVLTVTGGQATGGSTNGGGISLTGGIGVQYGGAVTIASGDSNNGGLQGRGSKITLAGGFGGGGGGDATIEAGNANNGWSGGNINLNAGNYPGAGSGGTIQIVGGAYSPGNGGNIIINGGAKAGAGVNGNVILANSRGNVGIATTAPAGVLHVADTVATNTALFERSGQTTDGAFTTARFLATKTTAMGNNFGSGIGFYVQDNDGVKNPLSYLGGVRNGADNTGDMYFGTYAAGVSNERMRITSAGYVGIGTQTPLTALHLVGPMNIGSNLPSFTGSFDFVINSTTGGIILNRTGGNEPFIRLTTGTASSGGQVRGTNTGGLRFTDDGATIEWVRISSTGNVGIGTTSPQTPLQVEGVISPATNNIYSLGNATYRFTEVYATNGVINTSDRREKKDIYNTDLGLDFINKLRPVSYRWNTGVDNDIHYGLIAQEAEQAIAEVRNNDSKNKTSIVTHDEKTDRYGVRYSELISPLIKAVQELYSRLMNTEAHQSIQDREIAFVKSTKADKIDVDAKIQKLEFENEKLKQENMAIKNYLCNKDKNADICK